MSEDHREYLRDLAMHVLADARAAELTAAELTAAELTAAEVAERMGIVAMGDGHPKRSWSSIDGWTVSGVLRRLEGDGLAVRGDPRQQIQVSPSYSSPFSPPPQRHRQLMTSQEWEATGGVVERLPNGAVSRSVLRHTYTA